MLQILLALYGGLGLFIFGMEYLSDALQRAAGDRLRILLERLTGTTLRGIMVGTAVTGVIQSSGATTVMLVGLVNAGLMTLEQSIGVVFGADIGTTVTGQLVAFRLTDIALPMVGVGFTLHMFGRRSGLKRLGEVLLGLGLLFLGMKIMSDYLSPAIRQPWATEMLITLARKPLLGVVVGAVFTAIIQSSSASTGLLIALAAEGSLDLAAAMPVVLGANIGSCSTALLASIGTSKSARRTAVVHLIIKVLGVALVFPWLGGFEAVVTRIGTDPARQIANAHTLFNILMTVALVPFIRWLTRLAILIVPGVEETFAAGPRYLDRRFLATPALALSQARKETLRMGRYAMDSLRQVFDGVMSNDASVEQRMIGREQVTNGLESSVTNYLAELATRELSDDDSRRLADLIMVTKDIERVGDHAESIARLAREKAEAQIQFSPEATRELQMMFALVEQAVVGALDVVETGTEDPNEPVHGLEDQLDQMERQLRAAHVRRLTEQICTPAAGIIFLDVASHFERIGDHAANIGRLMEEKLTT